MKGYWYVPGLGRSVKFYDGSTLQLAKEILKLCLLIVALICFVLVTVFFYQERPVIAATLRDAHVTVLEAGLTLRNMRQASAQWQKASENSQATAKHADKAIKDLDAFVKHTDFQLNRQVLPTIGSSIEQNTAQLIGLERSANQSLLQLAADSQSLTTKTGIVLDAATQDLSDPAIALSLKNVGESSQSLATATSEAAATMSSVRKGVEYEVHEITKPVTAVKKVVLFVAELAGKFLGI